MVHSVAWSSPGTLIHLKVCSDLGSNPSGPIFFFWEGRSENPCKKLIPQAAASCGDTHLRPEILNFSFYSKFSTEQQHRERTSLSLTLTITHKTTSYIYRNRIYVYIHTYVKSNNYIKKNKDIARCRILNLL